jgi:N-acetylglucosamine-6-phosphate deacetylase
MPVSQGIMETLLREARGQVRVVTISPELPNALEMIAELRRRGIVPGAGHSAATFEQGQNAFKAGLRHVTHVFNAMTPMHHRAPGLLGAALTDDRVTTELIADGVHVCPEMLKFTLKLKGIEKLLLISDANWSCGLPDGEHSRNGGKITVKNGAAMSSGGRLCGSTLTLAGMVRSFHKATGVPLNEAVKMATLNPARLLGIERQRGVLAEGARADVVVLGQNLDVKMVFIAGNKIR